MFNVDLNYDQCNLITLATLLDSIDDPFLDETTRTHIHHVIAYFSEPGSYENGKYDSND